MMLHMACRYIISVNDDHVKPFLPYISDTGGKVPESCIFSLLLSLAAFLGELFTKTCKNTKLTVTVYNTCLSTHSFVHSRGVFCSFSCHYCHY